ncbi:hypothetical protein V2I01_03875 [Micromonospora sp. BRA006-A]|nr:hypothetical protein [Micromonospora sp. BRA006-A]
MLGLLATDRLVLLIRHRVLLQSAHRATGVLGVAGLVFHVITKVAIGRAGPTDAVVPSSAAVASTSDWAPSPRC